VDTARRRRGISSAAEYDRAHAGGRRIEQGPALIQPARVRFALALTVVGAVVLFTYVRLYFGVDLTDESFYAAVPLAMAQGARPLVDETNVAQLTPGILLLPFVKAYYAVAGLDGLILYMRHLHLLFSIAVSSALFVSLRRHLRDSAVSAILASAAVAFVPFGIHGLSYDTFGSGFFAAGCFLGLPALQKPGRLALASSGTALGLAIFTYPPLVVPAACYVGALYPYLKPRSWRTILPIVTPAVVACLGTTMFFLSAGFGTAHALFARASTYGGQGGGVTKGLRVISSVMSDIPHVALVTVLLACAFVFVRLRTWVAILPVFALPVVLLPIDLSSSASSNEFVTSFGMLAPIVFLLVARDHAAAALMRVVWLPALVAGEMTAVTSGNGSINFAIGFFPAAVVTASLASLVVRGVSPRLPTFLRAPADLATATTFVLIGVVLQYAYVYRDAHLSRLRARVDGGAYAGLYTAPATRAFLRRLNADLAATSGPACTILFYDAFPAGYLLGRGRADTNTAFLLDLSGTSEASYEQLLISYYARHHGPPDVAVRIDGVPVGGSVAAATYRQSDPLERLFRPPLYQTLRVRPEYRISRRVGTNCRPAPGTAG